MDSKKQVVSDLEEIFSQWRELIGRIPQEQVSQPFLPSQWTLKDVMAHLWSWQQASVARLEAALLSRDPIYPDWWVTCGPDPNDDVDKTNAYLYAASQEKTWEVVIADWQKQFQLHLDLLIQLQEPDLLEPGRFAWMGLSPLIASPRGSWDHHREHYDETMTWLRSHSRDFSKNM